MDIEGNPSLELIATLEGHKDRVWNCSWRPQGDILATCSGDKTIRIWSKSENEWKTIKTLNVHDRTVRRVSFSPDGRFLAAASFDATISVFEYSNGTFELIQKLQGHENEAKGVAWDNTGSLLATCSRDKSVWVFEMESDFQFECISVCQSHTQDVKNVLWHPTQEVLVSCSYDDTLKVWIDYEDDWECVETLEGHKSTVWDASFNSDGNYLISCSEDSTCIIWKYDGNQPLGKQFKILNKIEGIQKRSVYSIDWSKTNYIATGSSDDSIRIFRFNEKTETVDFITQMSKSHFSDVNCVKWSPSGEMLASCSDDKLIKLWKLK